LHKNLRSKNAIFAINNKIEVYNCSRRPFKPYLEIFVHISPVVFLSRATLWRYCFSHIVFNTKHNHTIFSMVTMLSNRSSCN